MTASFDFIVETKDVQKTTDAIVAHLTPVELEVFLHEQAVPWLGAEAEKRFASEGDDASGKWQPLKPTTMVARALGRQEGRWDVGDAHPINIRTHQLENYILHGMGDTVPTSTGATLVYPGAAGLGQNVRKKLTTAQRGEKESNTPPRPVLALGERDVEYLLTRLVDHVMSEL